MNKLVLASLFVAISLILKYVLEIYITQSLRFNFCNVPLIISGILLGPFWGFGVGVSSDLINFVVKPGGVFHPGFTLSSGLVAAIPGIIFYFYNKSKSKSRIKYPLLNALIFALLLIGVIALVWIKGLVTYESGQLFISTYDYATQALKPSPVSWYMVAAIIVLLIGYSFFLVKFLRKSEDERTIVPADVVLFSVSCEEVVASLILNSYFLYGMYGTASLADMPLRALKLLVTIPLFSFLAFSLTNIVKRNKLLKN